MVNLLVVTHGEFGAYLIEAAEGIVGRQEGGIRSISISARLGLEEVRRGVAGAVRELAGADGLVIVTDMPGGTPSNVALPLSKDLGRVRVISGLNLYMLVCAFGRRGEASLDELAQLMLSAGQRSIQDIRSAFLAQCGR